ncbi:MAG: hypothetical protein HFE64_02045 [Lachnospiraceae bacterium]|nr:hypothetical protein [Lachnospiraceae bacterium]
MKKVKYIVVLFFFLYMITLLGCSEKDKVYHWAILQNGRRQMDEDQMQRINERLQEMGIEGRIEFHYVTVEGLVTPEVVEQAYKDLGRKMDFVSISPSLVAFTKQEWKDTFLELSEELKNGGLQGFYERIPEAVWEANQMAGGLYSFSWSSMIRPHGFGFCEQTIERVGKENLLKLTEANGTKDEEIWKELYEANGEQAICLWTGMDWGHPEPTAEIPYGRQTLDKFTNGWRRHYFWMIMDDVGYNYETERFEWLGESETYQDLYHGVVEFYKKGYIRNINIDTVIEYDADIDAGQVFFGYDNQVEENNISRWILWVPSWEKVQLDPRPVYGYVYSFVYKEAREGWQEVLNAIGMDEEITEIINKKDDMTLTRILYEQLDEGTPVPPQVDDMYTFLEEIYSKREKRAVTDFIFNPLPIQDILRECERRASAYASTDFYNEDAKGWSERKIVIEKVEDFWQNYQDLMKDSPIHEVVEEVNRQYQEWIQK